MRAVLLVLAVVMGVSGTADAKRIACLSALDGTPQFAPRRDDLVQPATPVIRDVTVGDRELHVNATFSADTAYVHVTIRDERSQRFEIWTTPDRLFLCTHDLDIALGDAVITVAAVDASGLSSAAVWPTYVRSDPPRRYRCGAGMMGLLLLVPVVLVALGIGLLIVLALRRGRLRKPGEPVPPLVAESIARSMLGESWFAIVCATVVIAMLYVTGDRPIATFVAVFPVLRLFRIAACRRVLRALDAGVTARLHGNLLAADDDHLYVPTRIVVAAHAHGVPTSVVHSRPGRG